MSHVSSEASPLLDHPGKPELAKAYCHTLAETRPEILLLLSNLTLTDLEKTHSQASAETGDYSLSLHLCFQCRVVRYKKCHESAMLLKQGVPLMARGSGQ
jgi:hypothetical protein